MSGQEKPKPDYWVIRSMYGTYFATSQKWTVLRKEARKFSSRAAAKNSWPGCKVIAVRRKPSTKQRIAELVAKCKAAIDVYREKNPFDPKKNAQFVIVGNCYAVHVWERALQHIDPAAAAEIRQYWERK